MPAERTGTSITLDGTALTAEQVELIARGDVKVNIAPSAYAAIRKSRAIVERYLESGIPAYGLNTGLGARAGETLPTTELEGFSYRMVRGRAQGVGPALAEVQVRAIMAVRLNTMLTGGAGQSLGVADYVAEFLSKGLTPVVPRIASIGATDLVAMAAIPHALIGEGEIILHGQRMPASRALQAVHLAPLKLGPKDGQVLCNNTAFTTGQAVLTARRAERALMSHVVAAALAFEGFRGNSSPLEDETVKLRPLAGQIRAARELRRLLNGGLLLQKGEARRLQDPLSIRCMAQVFGSSFEALEQLEQILSVEINSSSDNPAVLIQEERIVTTGNFHQLQLSLGLDQAGRALGWCATDGVSRIARLLNSGFSGLPPLLSSRATERAGFGPLMKPIEALRGEIVHLANPVAIMPSHNADGQEDSLSHAPLAAQKLADLVERYEMLVAFELMAAAQAIDLAKPAKIAPQLEDVHAAIRRLSPFIDDDRPMGREIEAIADDLVRSGKIIQR
jgi:histidine ammonia-lyase